METDPKISTNPNHLTGRLRGKSKLGQTAKENIIAVFTRMGGTAEMARWAKNNQTEFYKLYAKLIPLQVSTDTVHRFVMELPAPAESTDQWLKDHAPKQLTHLQ
jgi:hypothetical protein